MILCEVYNILLFKCVINTLIYIYSCAYLCHLNNIIECSALQHNYSESTSCFQFQIPKSLVGKTVLASSDVNFIINYYYYYYYYCYSLFNEKLLVKLLGQLLLFNCFACIICFQVQWIYVSPPFS